VAGVVGKISIYLKSNTTAAAAAEIFGGPLFPVAGLGGEGGLSAAAIPVRHKKFNVVTTARVDLIMREARIRDIPSFALLPSTR